jgi:hypothetical protein
MGRTTKLCLAALLLVCFPAVAYADAGTPLMWAGMFHLALGNLLLGVGEGLLLAWLFRRSHRRRSGKRCVAAMIAANYFSAWVGGVLLALPIPRPQWLDIYHVRQWLACMVVMTYALTLVLEWPFVAFCIRKCDGWFRKSIWGSLIVQSASYAILFGWYWASSATSLFSGASIVPPSAIRLSKDVVCYYISSDGREVYSQDFGQPGPTKIGSLKPSTEPTALVISGSANGQALFAGKAEPFGEYSSEGDRLANLKCNVADPPTVGLRPGGPIPRFANDNSAWEFTFGWMAGRLDGRNARTGQNVSVGLETPFLRWPVSCPTQLPTGQVVFQLGADQICVFDPAAGKVALLARGRQPLVIIKQPLHVSTSRTAQNTVK